MGIQHCMSQVNVIVYQLHDYQIRTSDTEKDSLILCFYENTSILTLHWSTHGYFRTVHTCESTYDISGICTPTQHTGHTHTLYVTYTIDQQSLRAYFTGPIYTTRTRFTSILYARTIYAPTYAHNKCQRITCTIYTPNLRVKPTS